MLKEIPIVSKVYTGFLTLKDFSGEGDDVLTISDRPLAEVLGNDIETYGNNLTVRYYISEHELSEEELQEAFLETVLGVGEACYFVAYSEITGSITDEYLNVGGHNLLSELKSSVGKYLHMTIEFQREL